VVHRSLEQARGLQAAGAAGDVVLRHGGLAQDGHGRGTACLVVDETRVDGQVLESIKGLPCREMKRRGVEKSVMASTCTAPREAGSAR
jgi:hypothetical protein